MLVTSTCVHQSLKPQGRNRGPRCDGNDIMGEGE